MCGLTNPYDEGAWQAGDDGGEAADREDADLYWRLLVVDEAEEMAREAEDRERYGD